MWTQTLTAGLFAAVAAATASVAGAHDGGGQWVGLTHELSAESIFWPTADPLELTVDA